MIIDILIDKIIVMDNPTVVGLDPRLSYIPNFIKKEAFDCYGKTPKGVSEAFKNWGKKLIDAIHDIVPAIKPQIAMYEQYGADGIDAYINTIAYAKEKGLVIIGDIKRSDITQTAQAYSDGHIGIVSIEGIDTEIYGEDFVTLNAYLGIDSIEPYIKNCEKHKKGIFILVKTSNPNSGQLQDLDVGGMTLYEKVGTLVCEWGNDLIGKHGYSSVGAVVGATHPNQAKKLREIMPNTFFLVPGYGAQGATAKELSVCFDKNGLGAIVNSSRGIISAYQNEKYANFSEAEFDLAARQATLDMKNALKQR